MLQTGGPLDAYVGRTRTNLGEVLVALGRYDEAAAHAEAALQAATKTRPAGHPDIDQARQVLALARAHGKTVR